MLYSENYGTAYWLASGQPLYSATVSTLVNSVIQTQVITIPANANEVAQAILSTPVNTPMPSNSLGEFITKKLLTLAKYIGLK